MSYWSVENDRASQPTGLESVNLGAAEFRQDAVIVPQ
jgi:hypothetical protein